MKKEYLIDGYNLIHAAVELKKTITSFSMNRARGDLISAVGSYISRKKGEGVIVFDGIVQNRAASPRLRIMSSGKKTADTLIQEQIRVRGKSLIVVTSDLEIIETARVNMAEVIPSGRFARQLGFGAVDEQDRLEKPSSARVKKDGRPHRIEELKEESEKPNMMSDGEMDEWKRMFGVD